MCAVCDCECGYSAEDHEELAPAPTADPEVQEEAVLSPTSFAQLGAVERQVQLPSRS